jgi:hypothetical protein
MAFWNRIFARSRDEPRNIPTGRVSAAGNIRTILSPYRSRSAKLLDELRRISDEANAIEFIVKKTPDASMALWNFIRLANQGHQMKFYGINTRSKGVVLTDVEEQWREFAARINSISNSGLDGLIDIFHKNGILYGLQMCEVEVNADRTDIVEVHPIDPRTVTWELEERDGKKVWIPYQYGFDSGKIDLSKGNIFAVPTDPDGNDPRGNLIMAPALQAIDSQLQVFNDVHAVLHHQGYVRDFYQINLERMMKYCPAHVKNDAAKLQAWLKEQYDNIVNTLKNIHPDSDIVTFDDVNRNQGQGSNVSRSVDFRAINELTDIQTLNGLKQLGIFENRSSGRTETWSSVEMKIFVQGILSLQRGSKRLIEEIARLWLRVKGIQAIPVFTHNVVDWQSELDKINVALLKEKFYAIAVIMNWIDNNKAAQEVMGVENAVGTPPLDTVRVSFSNDSSEVINNKIKMLEGKQKEIDKKVIDLFGR